MISAIARDLAKYLTTTVEGKPQVMIGPPAEAEAKAADAQPVINLFLFRFEPSAFYPDAATVDPIYLRIHCLITAYATVASSTTAGGSAETLGAGEICLRLLEGIIQAFHEDPVRTVAVVRTNPDGQQQTLQTLLQIILKPLTTEELNQIWATQGDVHYRSSLLYEFAVAPITPWSGRPSAKTVAEDGRVIRVDGSLVNAHGDVP
ncbi:DUF4255 domain-containing protein [Mesorhizobium sp. M1233]|uniref:Pvc16 family protein n=1 Tax=unclassified Mesorhizobium TaxID=325217 RepID=UPI003335D975